MPQVKITWTDNVVGEDMFEIKRKPTLASPETVVGTVATGSVSFIDTAPLVGTTSYYSVQAVKGTSRIESAFMPITIPAMSGTIDNIVLILIP